MSFFYSNTNFQFDIKKPTQRSYIVTETLPIKYTIELIDKIEFAKVTLNRNSEIFIIYFVTLKSTRVKEMMINPSQVTQLAALQQDKALTQELPENFDYINLFSSDLEMEFLKNIGIITYVIKLVDRKQLPYESIYTFNLVELETLKAYITTHLKTRLIKLSKSSDIVFIYISMIKILIIQPSKIYTYFV